MRPLLPMLGPRNAAAWLIASVALVACLPGDDRPEPGSLLVSAEASAATKNGFTTADDWKVAFDRVVIAVGDIEMYDEPRLNAGVPCNDYSRTYYNRLFDFTVVGHERVGIMYGLGSCSVGFALRPPNGDTILGPGTSDADLTAMRSVSSFDDFDGLTAVIRGRATKGGVQKSFDWSFRGAAVVTECNAAEGAGFVSIIDLDGGDAFELTLEARAQELFRVAPDDEEPLHFDAFAAADGAVEGTEADGIITMDELAEVDAPPPTVVDPDTEPPIADPEAEPPKLSDVLRFGLAPRMMRVKGGGQCLPSAGADYDR
jgi:hypothetical protein